MHSDMANITIKHYVEISKYNISKTHVIHFNISIVKSLNQTEYNSNNSENHFLYNVPNFYNNFETIYNNYDTRNKTEHNTVIPLINTHFRVLIFILIL